MHITDFQGQKNSLVYLPPKKEKEKKSEGDLSIPYKCVRLFLHL